ncbi:hypothetical protein CfE428DRAFT_5016 [Chthoniobacter flavus Ellin428]|uniref:DUF4412 domain-containing protein n=1 Tax=Chthoniobacter flavus Ellin428 TaxID=497964 RepID=B4D7X6_9BACT|nr:DUF4412 domain-containing protein [Chthoniobacter flavus]EDY17499.1 hypothetical protein CfE428DRAFT_5016 [Chthoniobacter flavus Ellin428]TCO92294.1 uncharacterized protein DUF4412 [Chthoniobacter flavus]
MKALLTALAASAIFIATASADWVIESKIESPQLNSATTTKVKGDKLRVDIPSGPVGAMSSIVDTKTGDAIQLVHSQKMAVKTGSEQLKAAMEAAKQKAGIKGASSAELKPTGQSEKVGDYDCDVYTWSDGSTTSKLWVAKNHPQAAALKAFEKQMKSGILGGMQVGPDTSTLPGPTIKTETTTQGMTVTNTITSIKEQDVDAKEFEVPADYQTMQLPAAPPSGK